ncbi:putative cell-to-cell movement protein [Tobacco vein clearing virus]|uniref:Putative cell-to-cell movement protein n=1 Tax=Tobacco vein clearing virus TaxID=107324 RepID=Q9QD05_9VIRU|nr:putative cell-to-cell movement protein [Tobacco vein clearing virus]AAF08288.1 putative cell-to-cell movement protein [Tobacco vein clearing virus]
MTEKEIKVVAREEYQNEESSEQKIIFDNNIFEQIKGKELDLSVEKIFEVPTIKNWFKRQKEEYYVVSQKEHIIDCKYTGGKAKIPIINKRIINKEIQDIKAKNPIKYVHLGGTEILIKACFREGIDTPIEIYLADDRIIQPIEKSIISAIKGNLIYQKFKFIISANYSVALNDRNIDKSLVLYWKMSGIELAPGSKVFTARCKNLYVLTTKHKIAAKNKINKIKIENPFERIVTVIDNNEYSYKEIDMEEDLEIVKERLSTSSIPKQLTHETPTSSRISTSKREYIIPKNLARNTIEEIKPYHYYITGIMEQRKYQILINTGQEENYIIRELVAESEIITTEQLCPELPKELIINEEITEKEIIIGGIPLIIQFKIYQGNENITLGIKWLERLKPYNLEDKQLTITYKNKKVIIKRTEE